MSTPLNNETMSGLAGVAVPTYDRSGVTPGIVHFGVGAFHRAHQAMYLDRLLATDASAREWGICGVGVRTADAAMRDALGPQDGLFTLTLKHPDGAVETSVIGSIVEYLYAPDDPEKVIERLSDPATRIVSLTVTEGGYNFSPSTGEFDATNPDIVADLEASAPPRTVFGLVTEALARRRDRGVPSFTVMSCDNIQGNGHMARSTFLAYAQLRDPELAAWIASNTRFPNSMVDRITPATPPELAAEVADRTGVDDNWPVVAEPFMATVRPAARASSAMDSRRSLVLWLRSEAVSTENEAPSWAAALSALIGDNAWATSAACCGDLPKICSWLAATSDRSLPGFCCVPYVVKGLSMLAGSFT